MIITLSCPISSSRVPSTNGRFAGCGPVTSDRQDEAIQFFAPEGLISRLLSA